jgi:regulatory protein
MDEALNTPRKWTKENAWDKITRYATYQERCTSEIIQKLTLHGVYGQLQLSILDRLIEEKYLDDYRYTTSYVRGKLALKWGINKIKFQLSLKNIPLSIIDAAVNDLTDHLDLKQTQGIRNLIRVKLRSIKKDEFGSCTSTEKGKILKYIISKGYSFEDVEQVIKDY